jgi:hypothetical protein
VSRRARWRRSSSFSDGAVLTGPQRPQRPRCFYVGLVC